MHLLFTIIVTFFAGMGAGLGTGFAGMSAAAVISPILITFLGIDPYIAVGIALSSDVLASAVSAYTYGKNKNLDIKNGLIMMVTVLIFTIVGSYISSLVPSATMGNFSVFMTFLLGIKFIVRPVMTTKEAMQGVSAKKRAMQSVICGIIIGFICGFIGAGGGAKSPLWRQIIANVMNLKVDVLENEEGPALGGAMLAAVGCGEYPDVETAAAKIVKVVDTVTPEPELTRKYEERYQYFRRIYPTVKELF